MPFNPGSGGGGASNTQAFAQTAHGFVVGDELYISGLNTFAKTDADSPVSAEWIGTVSAVADANNFTLRYDGIYVTDKTGLTAGQTYYISGTAGALTATEPTAVSSVSKPVFTALNTTSGFYHNFRGSPSQGQTAVVSYVNATRSTNLTLASGTDIAFDTVASGDIPMAAGVFSLIAGKTYHLYASIRVQGGQADFAWVDAVTNVALVNGALGTAQGSSGISDSPVDIIYTPSANQTVKLRVTGIASAPTLNGGYGGASIVQIGASPVPMSLVGEYVGPNYGAASLAPTGITSATAIDYLSVVIPTAGTWLISWAVRGSSNSTVSGGIATVLTDSTNAVQANSEALAIFPGTAASVLQATASGQYVVTTSGAATYKVRVYSISNLGGFALSDNNGRSFVTARKISGFTPSSGSTVDFVNVGASANIGPLALNQTVIFNSLKSGNIPYNTTTGLFSLTAGKTYKLSATYRNFTAASQADLSWFDGTTNTALVTHNDGGTTTVAQDAGHAEVIYTPAANQTVRLAVAGVTGTPNLESGKTHANIVQLGSSATIAGPFQTTWTAWTPVVTGSVSNPTLPTSAVFNCNYLIIGKVMFANFKYYAAAITGNSPGSGVYRWSIPAGYTIDTTNTPIPTVQTDTANAGIDGGCIGSGFGRNATASNSAGLNVMPLTSTTFGFWFEAQNRLVGSGALATNGAANTAISATMQIPIL